jgi:hypothetical protein
MATIPWSANCLSSRIAGPRNARLSLSKSKYETKNAPYMEKLSIDQNGVVLKDNKRNRIAEVMLKEGELQCLLDEKSDCVHVGFVYSLPELYNMNNKIKAPANSAYIDTK